MATLCNGFLLGHQLYTQTVVIQRQVNQYRRRPQWAGARDVSSRIQGLNERPIVWRLLPAFDQLEKLLLGKAGLTRSE
ncbi:hypothetical protein D3C84_1016930 [compost metagenome]